LLPDRQHIFLLSPANVRGLRAELLLRKNASSELAVRLRNGGAPLGELFTFMSGLYFRGKLAYARAFAAPPPGISGAFVITAGAGLVPPETPVTLEWIRAVSAVDVDPHDGRYRGPLDRDAQMLLNAAGPDCDFVLLGSIATQKYTGPLGKVFGRQLVFPAEFTGRGDMSRGGLMVRCVNTGAPLTYIPVLDAPRHGSRPPKLAPLPRTLSSGTGALRKP
jgi:hypothetical protein